MITIDCGYYTVTTVNRKDMKKTDQNYVDMPKIIIFQQITCAKKAFLRPELHLKFSDQLTEALIGGEICFSQKGSCKVSKCPSFCVDFKNVNLPW
jgi:hypothetical protein